MSKFITSSFEVNVVRRPHQIMVIDVAGRGRPNTAGQMDDRVQ
jgi:hypothetical protein